MFDNLVESGSHKQDLGRKGSFLLGTLAIYGIIRLALLVTSIWSQSPLSIVRVSS